MARQRRKRVNEAAVRPAHAASQKKKRAAHQLEKTPQSSFHLRFDAFVCG